MANRRYMQLNSITFTRLFVGLLIAAVGIKMLANPSSVYAACTTSGNIGAVQKSLLVESTGTYKIWLKTSGASVPVGVELDGGTCVSGTSQASTQWVLLGNAPINAGNHTVKAYAYGGGVTFYAVMATDASSACTPSGDGSNCVTEYNNSVGSPSSGGGSTPATPPAYANVVNQNGNLASTATITASTSCCGFTPTKVIDKIEDNSSNRWISDSKDGEWLLVDLRSTKILKTLSVLWAADTTKNHTVQVSTDGSTFKNVVSSDTNNATFELLNYNLGDQNARYVRILTNSRWNATYGNSIRELGVYEGTAASTGNPSGGSGAGTGVIINPTPTSGGTKPVTKVTPGSSVAIDPRLTTDNTFTNSIKTVEYLVGDKIIKTTSPQTGDIGITSNQLPTGTYDLTEKITMQNGTVITNTARIHNADQLITLKKAVLSSVAFGSVSTSAWVGAVILRLRRGRVIGGILPGGTMYTPGA